MANQKLIKTRERICGMVPEDQLGEGVPNADPIEASSSGLKEEVYQGMIETVYISADPALKMKIMTGLQTPLSECISGEEDHLAAYQMVYTKEAMQELPDIKAHKMDEEVKACIQMLRTNPYESIPVYHILCGDLQGALSRTTAADHRLVYQVYQEEQTVKLIHL